MFKTNIFTLLKNGRGGVIYDCNITLSEIERKIKSKGG